MIDERTYLLKISLCHIEPEIWRRFLVPGRITLDRLHDVIQIIMGWEDYHLFDFTIGKKRYTEDPESKEDGIECGKYRLEDLIKQKGRKFSYTYDFGDNWEHCLVVEDSRYENPELEMDFGCLEGAGNCPPEDLGGPHMYPEFIKAVNDPGHDRYQDYQDWLKEGFDPGEFDLDLINYQLMKYLRWSRDRYRNWYHFLY